MRFLRIIIVVAALATCVSFQACTRTEQKPAGPPEKVTVALSKATDATLAVIAQEQGYYQQEGLEVTPHLHSYGKLALQDVMDGNADFATVAETPVMFAILNGAKISVIATIKISNMDNAIVARKDRGIRTESDLKGKKLAATSGTTADYFMNSFLTAHGIPRKDVKVVNLKAEELPDALAQGKVDAASLFQPYILQAQKKLGDRGISFFDGDLYTSTTNIVAEQDFISKNSEKVKKLLNALIKAEKFAREHPEQAQKIVAEFARIDLAMTREIWTSTIYSVSLDQTLVLALEDESRWAIKSGLTGATKVPNYLDYIYFDGLKSVKPEAVRILR